MEAALDKGLFALLFVALFWWVLRENKAREDRYLQIIQTLGDDVKERLEKLELKIHGQSGGK